MRSRRLHRRQRRARWGARKDPFASEIRWLNFEIPLVSTSSKIIQKIASWLSLINSSHKLYTHTIQSSLYFYNLNIIEFILYERKLIWKSTCSKRTAAQSSNELLALVCSPLLLPAVCFVGWLRLFSNVLQLTVLKSNKNYSRKIEKSKSWKKKNQHPITNEMSLFTRKLRRKERARRKYNFALRCTHSKKLIDTKFLYKIFYSNFK